jgi:hydrogenase nickel incorporation protein HypB
LNRIEINEKVLSKNDIVAARIREKAAQTRTAVINLTSSPGSGKTSLLEALLPRLQTKYRLAVIEGDLRTENDADRLRQRGINAIQIQTGDACHLEAAQVEALLGTTEPAGCAIELETLDLLIIENIGNLVCPASYDLGEDAFFVMLSVTEGDDKPAKYPTIFFNADYFILNKIDLAPYVDFSIEKCIANALAVNARLKTATISARTGAGLDEIAQVIEDIIVAKKAN